MTLTITRKKELLKFLKSLDIELNNLQLLNIALTHSSYTQKDPFLSNERLEFFGDAVLKLYISEYLMDKFPQYSEGKLSNLCAYVISEKVLSSIATKLSIKKYLLVGKNEKKDMPQSILADALEAILAVIYYECGEVLTRNFIVKHWTSYIQSANLSFKQQNYKAILQEYTQGNKIGLPTYKVVSEVGPDHNKNFEMTVLLNGKEISRGNGKTKKEASQNAAKNALQYLNVI